MTTQRDLAASARSFNQNDPRAQRSRDAIMRVARELSGGPVGELTVAHIVSKAGISKSTFYQHFTGLDDVLLLLLEDALGSINYDDLVARHGEGNPLAITVLGHRRVIAQFEEHATLFTHVLTSEELSRARDGIVQLITDLLDRTMRAIPHPPDVDIPVAARFVASGFVGVIIDWFQHGRARDPDELAASLAQLTPEWFRS
ncbi:TetR/AcrR family transcriptional regulator [Cryobacterium sp. BB307]|uniref:TetR/AcrR family transcriptional regulator n=1 Tax=Cryobacterium sp. BB307 TaxID=2716317 RepID=UPI001445ACBC|nr:TetR/AcrR family transcriptional regulator [Cryobacterium sp. BB307]